jgi:glutamate-1-semialdehyde 2,1-aminomutase
MQIGTLSGNPVAAAAGVATLKVLKRPGTYEKLFKTGAELMAGMARIVKDAGLAAQVIGAPPMFDVIYADGDLHDYRAVQRGDRDMQTRINRRLREGGVLKGESKFYVSIAHDGEDVRHTLAAFAAAVKQEEPVPAGS